MRADDIIRKKRDGQVLTETEIAWFVQGYTTGDIPDYQAAAFLMAVYLRGMTDEETTALTLSMAHSGTMMDLSDIVPYAVDKHSSGGVGDKTTLIVLPLVAAVGVTVAKMSGRGLGFSGGTLDKLEAIPGFEVNLTETQFRDQAKELGIVLCGQTGELAPADGKFYALRDVTATVSSIPLIASSIMSKKLAAGANGIVLDVKVGCGAFMTNLDEARKLARMMRAIGEGAGRDVTALLSDMNQPLGEAVGNALEVSEALDALDGGGPADLRAHCLEIAAEMLLLAGQGERWTDLDGNRQELAHALNTGAARAKLRDLVSAQHGDARVLDNRSLLPSAALTEQVVASSEGYVAEARADQIAQAALVLGAGRKQKGDKIDLSVGVVAHAKVGDAVRAGEVLATIYARTEAQIAEAKELIESAYMVKHGSGDPLPLFYDRFA